MEYLVTGATGLIGTNVTEQLVAAGHDVVALTRSRENADHLPETVRVVEGDVTNKNTLREPMGGVDGVFHIAAWFYLGAGAREAARAESINVDGTRNVLTVVEECSIPRCVYTSTVGVFPATSGEVIVESREPPCPTFSAYHRTKWQAHKEVVQPMMRRGLPVIVVLPSGVYGPGDKPRGSIRGIFREYLRGDLPALPRGLRLSFDHAADVADAHRRAMERGTPGEEYIVASEARSIHEMFACAEALTGIPAPRAVPDWVFGGLARVMRGVERVADPIDGFESELLAFAAGRQYDVDNSKARRELGIEHRSLEDGLREYFAWERDHLAVTFELTDPPLDASS